MKTLDLICAKLKSQTGDEIGNKDDTFPETTTENEAAKDSTAARQSSSPSCESNFTEGGDAVVANVAQSSSSMTMANRNKRKNFTPKNARDEDVDDKIRSKMAKNDGKSSSNVTNYAKSSATSKEQDQINNKMEQNNVDWEELEQYTK